ncbi:hypothetical protein Q7C36_007191 [Tachysurus vachellii]|uniref:Uncharacterized protein n=1 Tax=Tachysurus vachellii TaxID=175792 RepID=A0AA88NAN0_TACVA|nr:hypothetical protein Q7C36_007191 [Tachysurus vachellii]
MITLVFLAWSLVFTSAVNGSFSTPVGNGRALSQTATLINPPCPFQFILRAGQEETSTVKASLGGAHGHHHLVPLEPGLALQLAVCLNTPSGGWEVQFLHIVKQNSGSCRILSNPQAISPPQHTKPLHRAVIVPYLK